MAHDRPRPHLGIFLASAGFCVLLFAARLVYEVPGGGLGLLYVVPIVLVAQEYGRTCGIVAGAVALPLWVAGRTARARRVGRCGDRHPCRDLPPRRRAHRRHGRPAALRRALLRGLARSPVHRDLRRLLHTDQRKLGADARMDQRRAPGASLRGLRPSRRPTADRGGGRTHRPRHGHRVLHQPLPHEGKGRRLPLDRVVLGSGSPAQARLRGGPRRHRAPPRRASRPRRRGSLPARLRALPDRHGGRRGRPPIAFAWSASTRRSAT